MKEGLKHRKEKPVGQQKESPKRVPNCRDLNRIQTDTVSEVDNYKLRMSMYFQSSTYKMCAILCTLMQHVVFKKKQ